MSNIIEVSRKGSKTLATYAGHQLRTELPKQYGPRVLYYSHAVLSASGKKINN